VTDQSGGAMAVSLMRLDGEVSDAILGPIRAISAITEAKLPRFEAAQAVLVPQYVLNRFIR
jgi:hypothetical protein